ncbi:MAG: transposase [Coriobacteriia bacterium]
MQGARSAGYTDEFKREAVRLYRSGVHGGIERTAEAIGVGKTALRRWARQAQIDAGEAEGLTTEEKVELGRSRWQGAARVRQRARCGSLRQKRRQRRLDTAAARTAHPAQGDTRLARKHDDLPPVHIRHRAPRSALRAGPRLLYLPPLDLLASLRKGLALDAADLLVDRQVELSHGRLIRQDDFCHTELDADYHRHRGFLSFSWLW